MKKWIVFLVGWILAGNVVADWHSQAQAIMGTEVRVTVWHQDAAIAQQAIDAVMADMKRIDRQLSPWKQASELFYVNKNAGKKPVKISAELMRILDKSLYYGQQTEGAFDISFASVGHAYDFRAGTKPDAETRKQAVIDYRLIKLDKKKSTVFFSNPHIKIDLGGIAKGYAVDRAIDILGKFGIAHANVSAGGDSRLLGDHRGRPWIVGIKNPRNQNDVAIKLPLTNEALSTSGDYERFFIDEQGERIHHILNPRTGDSSSGIASVSVIGPRGFDTDPLSTSVFVLGVDSGMALLNRLPEFEGIIIDERGKVHYSEGLVSPQAAE